MLNRDFTKSNKDYFKKNWIVLTCVAVFLIIGILVLSFAGMKGNFEFTGYNEFSVTVAETDSENFSTYIDEIESVVNLYGGECDNISIVYNGDDSKLVVRYMNSLTAEQTEEINLAIADKVATTGEISEHVRVDKVVTSSDYLYTAVAIAIIWLVCTIFAYVRYNGASAMANLIANVISLLGFMSIGAILRLEIGLSYFAMLVILTLLTTYFAFSIFENIRANKYLDSNNYEMAITTAMKQNRSRFAVLACAVASIGLLFILFAPNPIRFVSINIMFMAVVLLAVSYYVVPFVWSALITHMRKKKVVVKSTEK